MFKLAIISSLVLLSSFNVYAQEKEQIEVWEEPSKSFAITKAIADFEAINDCEIKLREISSAKQLDVLKEHIKNGERIPDVMVTISDKFGEAQEDHPRGQPEPHLHARLRQDQHQGRHPPR